MMNLKHWFNRQPVNPKIIYIFLILALIGFGDAIYLTASYYKGTISCSIIAGCYEVLKSSYSTIFDIPIAILGALFYLLIIFMSLWQLHSQNRWAPHVLSIFPAIGFLFSIWLVYLQLFVIKYICIYCMFSALTSTLLFITSLVLVFNKKTRL